MQFGSDFDDDFFEKPKEKKEDAPLNRDSRMCYPNWFLQESPPDKDPSEILNYYRHQADYNYCSHNYVEASRLYEKCLEMLPVSNNQGRRECMENISRSYIHQKDYNNALKWAFKMHECAINFDQQVNSWLLLATVCHKLGKYDEELEALHSCLDANKFNPTYWIKLAYCYAGLFKIHLPHDNIVRAVTTSDEPCCAFKTKLVSVDDKPSNFVKAVNDLEKDDRPFLSSGACAELDVQANVLKCEMCTLGIQMISACLIRTRLLIQNTEPSPLRKEKYERLDQMISDCLNHMEVDQAFVDEASRMLRSEVLSTDNEESLSENAQTDESSASNVNEKPSSS